MFKALDTGLENTFTIIGTTNQVQGIERNHNAFERLLHKAIPRNFPDLVSKTQVSFEKSVQVFGLRLEPCLLDQLVEILDVLFARLQGCQAECQRLQLNPDIEDLL